MISGKNNHSVHGMVNDLEDKLLNQGRNIQANTTPANTEMKLYRIDSDIN